MSTFLQRLEAVIAKDEQWVVNEIAKGWHALQQAEETIQVDVQNIFHWISAHQADILSLFKGALTDLAAIGSVFPQSAPALAVATTAIDAATAAVDVLAKGIQIGSTPLSTVANAYHAVKDAQSAVNAVLKQVTAKPAS